MNWSLLDANESPRFLRKFGLSFYSNTIQWLGPGNEKSPK